MTALLRPAVLIPIALVGVVVISIGLYLFQPWKLFVDTTVNEASPLVSASPAPAPPDPASDLSTSAGQTPVPAPTKSTSGPVVVSTGTFISHEHGTTGTAQVIRRGSGEHVLRIEGLDTSNGPDLHVWLTDAPVIEGTDGWFVFDDGEYVDLGELKGNKGNQNYPIPADVDLSDLDSVSIWCERFSVSFGAAALT